MHYAGGLLPPPVPPFTALAGSRLYRPLAEVVEEFNRYNTVQLTVATPETGELLVGGTFRANDPETLVRLLESHFGIVVQREGRSIGLRLMP